MFQNLLISDMDSRKKGRVLPSYIEIIKQLSKKDAEFLKLLQKYDNMCSINITLSKNGEDGYINLDNYVIYDYKKSGNISQYSSLKLDELVIDTLIMHRIIEVSYEKYYTYSNAEEKYNTLYNSVKRYYKVEADENLSFDKGMVRLTNLGKNFVDICIS